MSKNIDISNNLYERKSTMPIHEEQISTKISEILSIYESGIQSIFDSRQRQTEDYYSIVQIHFMKNITKQLQIH